MTRVSARNDEMAVNDEDPWNNPLERERAMRFAANQICLWCLCGDPACRRAQACRGDVRACGGRIADWLDAIGAARRVCPSFAAMESRIGSAEELRAYRLFRRFWPQADGAPKKGAPMTAPRLPQICPCGPGRSCLFQACRPRRQ